MKFLREKFDLILVTVALAVVFGLWVFFNFEVKLEPYVFALFGSWLTVLGLRPRPNQTINAESIAAENLENAKTEHGDIVANKIDSKEKAENEI